VFGSLLTRPARLATRGVELTLRTTLGVIELAEGVVAAVAERIAADAPNGASAATGPDPQAAPDTPAGPDALVAPGPDASLGPETRPDSEGPPAPEPPSAEPILDAEEPSSAPEPPSATWRPVTETRDDEPLSPQGVEPVHVSEEPELVEEFAEPGAEQGAGAQPRIVEPWRGYNEMKAADIVDRMTVASREELATIELYELAGRNRKSVVAAAQRALKRASPPR
jgi:hypothetical protein